MTQNELIPKIITSSTVARKKECRANQNILSDKLMGPNIILVHWESKLTGHKQLPKYHKNKDIFTLQYSVKNV